MGELSYLEKESEKRPENMRSELLLSSIYDRQGRIEPLKAARGHTSSNSANIDSVVLNVTEDRGPCAACNPAHTIEVLISNLYMYTLSVST